MILRKETLLLKQTITQAENDIVNITKLNGMFLFQPGDWFWIVYQFDPAYGFAQGAAPDAPASLEHYNLTSSNKGLTWNTITSQFAAVNFTMYGLSNEGYPNGFISIQPTSGTVAGLSSANVAVNGNASTIRNGVYNYNLQVSSNDMNNPLAGTPMVVKVTGQKGTLTSKVSILDCKNVFIGKEGDVTIQLYNAGLSTLTHFTFTSDNPRFTAASLPDSLYPGDSVQFTARFIPTAAGQQLAKIKLGTNDGALNLSASGIGVNPPVMTLTGVPVQIVAKADSTGKNTFTISNKKGKYPLSYSMPEIAAINKAMAIKKLAKGTDPTLDYVWIDSQEPDGPVYSWTDISKTGTEITGQLASDYRNSKLFQLGFPMKFYGDTISQIYVNSFGALTLNYPGEIVSNGTYLPLPGDGLSGTIAGLFWEDIINPPVVGPNEHIFIKYAPGKFIVQYNDMEYFNGNAWDAGSFSMGKCTFQIVLYSNGKIEMNYKNVNNTWAQYLAQVGLENKAETKGISVVAFDVLPTPFVPADNTTLWFIPSAPKFITAISPLSGAVAVGDTVNITVTASAKGLVDSSYQSSIALTSNDPLQERLDVPVVLTVTGIQGLMQKTDTLAFGSTFKKASSKIDAVFLNTGTKPVMLLKTAFSDPAYKTDLADSTSVPALSELHIPVTFIPTAEKLYPATLTVTTDNAKKPVFKVILTGKGMATPTMTYKLTGGQTNTLNMGQTLPANLKVTNNGDGDLKIMVERPQWFQMSQPVQGIGNGLDSAQHTYSIHQNIDSSSAAYNWVELANGLGTSTVVDLYTVSTQEIKLPFAFPYYGKTYTSLFTSWTGDVLLHSEKEAQTIRPSIPSPLEPNGIISTANVGLVRFLYNGQIYYYADTSKMVVEYYNMAKGGFNDIGAVTFEMIFYKDGRIKMLYKSGEKTANYTQQFIVGIENENGTDGTMAYNRSLFYKDHGVIEFVPSVPYTLKQGESVDLPANWTTTSMTDGAYMDNLVIRSNDPLHAAIQIPLELDVHGTASMKTSDSINYGKVVAYNSPTDGPKSYTHTVLIKNNGTKTINISNIDFNGNASLVLDELVQNPDLFISPVVLAPGEELIGHVVFTPDSTMKSLNGHMNITSDYPTAISIPITATITLPPVVTTDSVIVRITMQQSDSAKRFIQLGNTGKGDLNYTLGIQYRRPGINYNSVAKAAPLKDKSKNAVNTVFGSGFNASLMDIPSATLGGSVSFADSILVFDPANHFISYIGTADDAVPIKAISHFNAGEKGIYLSHVGDLYRTDNMNPTNITFRIRLGSNVNTSTIIYEQSVAIQPDTTAKGIYLIAKLDSSILINAYEDFFIEWDYAPTMRFPQGIQYVSTDQMKSNTFYYRISDDGFFFEPPFTANYIMAAYAQTDSTGGWLTLTPESGAVSKNRKQSIKLTAHGPKVTPPDQSADLVVHSNDPATPELKLPVLVHIDQAPVLTNHDTLTVQEADSISSLIPATDDGGGKITIKLITKDPAAGIITDDQGIFFNYKPGYEDAGLHFFVISLADEFGNKRTDTLLVLVLNTNRPPVVVHHLKDRNISLKGPAITLALDTVFADPDGDAIQYSYAGDSNPLVKVFVNPDGESGIIPQDTGRASLVFRATDINGGMGYDTLNLNIRNNAAPVASAIPWVMVDKGSTTILDLSKYFSDEDPGDILTYTATMDSTGYATLEIVGTELVINGLKEGNRLITITADDGNGGTVDKSFILMINNRHGDNGYDYHIKVSPNPVHGLAYASFQLDKQKKVKIELVGIDGKPKGSLFEGNRSAGNQAVLINLYRYPNGNYYLKFTFDGDVRVVQISKL